MMGHAIDDNNAEWDAQSLAEAALIKADPGRLAAAESAAAKLAEEKIVQAKAMEDVANKENELARKFFPNSPELIRS